MLPLAIIVPGFKAEAYGCRLETINAIACPNQALAYGDSEDASSAWCGKIAMQLEKAESGTLLHCHFLQAIA